MTTDKQTLREEMVKVLAKSNLLISPSQKVDNLLKLFETWALEMKKKIQKIDVESWEWDRGEEQINEIILKSTGGKDE